MNKKGKQANLPEALGSYAQRDIARFHMPGHKGRGMGGFFRSELIRWDITELSFSDDLHNPEHSILDAQNAYAQQYGAAHTFFLVNGSTAGIHALLAALPAGSTVLIGRDCHRAVYAGVALAGHACAFVEPELAAEGMRGCVTPNKLDEALGAINADAVFLTSPTYYGVCADIPALWDVAKKHGALLFVDAAHGAHFPYSPLLPDMPYADGWVNSAHKTLNALGQAALLHIGERLPKGIVQRALSQVQTSSPSYLLIASLDWARYMACANGAWTNAVKICIAMAERIEDMLGLHTLPASLVGAAGIVDIDKTRLVVDVSERGLTGYEAQAKLEKSDIFIEMADQRRLVLICTPADEPVWYDRLAVALHALPYKTPGGAEPLMQPMAQRQAEMPLHQAVRAPVVLCALDKAAGHIAADPVGVYPPGIPLFAPGERITREDIAYLKKQQRLGASFFGVRDGAIAVVK